jgi:dCMP deaminase
MPTQKELDFVFTNIAKEIATLSKCNRFKVGAILVKSGNMISFGYNGTPTGMDNCCEDDQRNTKDHVIHAEMNAILKAASSGYAVNGSTLYLTLSPCKECSKLILQSGVKKVIYLEEYRDRSGIELLQQFISIVKHEI